MGARWAARPVSFTPAQYEELEQQALIYKYLVAGVPVPPAPDLVLPIRRGLDALATRFYGHPTRMPPSSSRILAVLLSWRLLPARTLCLFRSGVLCLD